MMWLFFTAGGTSPPTRLFFCCRYVPRNVPTTEKYAATPFCGGFPRNAPKAFIRTTIHIICKMASPQKPRFALQSHDWFSVPVKGLAYRSFAQFQFLIFDIHNGYFQKKVIQISQIFQIRQEKTAWKTLSVRPYFSILYYRRPRFRSTGLPRCCRCLLVLFTHAPWYFFIRWL